MKDSQRRAIMAKLRGGVSQYGIPFLEFEVQAKADSKKWKLSELGK